MKTSQKFKIAAIVLDCSALCFLAIGISMLVVTQELGLIAVVVVGAICFFVSIPMWFVALSPKIHGAIVNLGNEFVDGSKKGITDLSKKAVDIGADVVDYAAKSESVKSAVSEGVKSAVNSVKSAFSGNTGNDIEAELEKAKALLDKGVITQEEYEAMRKKILKIN